MNKFFRFVMGEYPMKKIKRWLHCLLMFLFLAVLFACAETVEAPTTEPTTTASPPTPTPLPEPCQEVPGACIELTFDGESCTYVGPLEMKAGMATVIFHNESDGEASPNLIRLREGKTIQDLIEYNGEEPSYKHAPYWATGIPGVWKYVDKGGEHVWSGELEPGIHAIVCARIKPLGVWLGGGWTVEE
jgi:hypothetical protein